MGRQTMFFPPKSKYLARIVKIDTRENARASVKKLRLAFKRAKSRAKRTRIKRATVLAANRAGATLKRKNISSRERTEMRQVQAIYKKAADGMHIQ